jgi:hypothetical protein
MDGHQLVSSLMDRYETAAYHDFKTPHWLGGRDSTSDCTQAAATGMGQLDFST